MSYLIGGSYGLSSPSNIVFYSGFIKNVGPTNANIWCSFSDGTTLSAYLDSSGNVAGCVYPTQAPTQPPSVLPSLVPTALPTLVPTKLPTTLPTLVPTKTYDIANTCANDIANDIANITTDSITNIHSNSIAVFWPNRHT